MYAAKTGVGSVLSPREMTMPSGSVELISLRSFFIDLSLDGCCTVVRALVRHPMCHVPRQMQVIVRA